MNRRNPGDRPAGPKRSLLAWTLAAIVALAMLMGTGPGVLLVNRPQTIAGVPLVYAWGILWYLVMVVVAIIAYGVFWKRDSDAADTTASSVKASNE